MYIAGDSFLSDGVDKSGLPPRAPCFMRQGQPSPFVTAHTPTCAGISVPSVLPFYSLSLAQMGVGQSLTVSALVVSAISDNTLLHFAVQQSTALTGDWLDFNSPLITDSRPSATSTFQPFDQRLSA